MNQTGRSTFPIDLRAPRAATLRLSASQTKARFRSAALELIGRNGAALRCTGLPAVDASDFSGAEVGYDNGGDQYGRYA
jgi:hypothetical protein